MSDSDKPFVCPFTGCNMSFINESHLTVHKKKHDMVLNLGNNGKNTVFVADQTPTPTRFIRNCEEVGLFQDLQNVNPFEETFRRAVEEGNTGTLTVPEAGITDDTLHTPHIFPHIADVLSSNTQILDENNIDECSPTITVTDKTTEEKDSMEGNVCTNVNLNTCSTQDLMKDVKLAASKDETLSSTGSTDQDTNVSVSKVISSDLSPQLSINGEEVQLLLKTSDGKLMQLTPIPVSQPTATSNTTHQIKQQTVVIKTEPSLRCAIKPDLKKPTISRLSLAKMKLKQVLTKSVGFHNQKSSDNSARDESLTAFRIEPHTKCIDQHKKKELLERNRASSMRARAKRKAWIQELERNVTNVNETNVALQMEVKALRNEVAKLKTLLLAHKDCPVTKAMQKGNGIVLGHKIITVNQDLTAVPTPVNAPLLKRVSPFTTDVSGATKKKLASASMKNPIIFPKVDCNMVTPIQNATIVKNLSTVKIMGVSQFLTEKEEAKQILIVQNPSRKLGETSPRQIIQINPNYEVEHAASKSTGA